MTLSRKEPRQLRSFSLVGRGEAPRHAGVVDEARKRAKRLRRLLEQAVKLIGIGDVGLESLRPTAQLLDFPDGRLSRLGVGGVVDGD